MTVKCCVIDVDSQARELVANYVRETPFMKLCGEFASAAEAIKTIMSGQLDVVFLDVNMPYINGIEFAEVVPSSCRVVYITAEEKYAVQAFKVNALDYLMKPLSYEDFLKSAKRALDWKLACNNMSTGNEEFNHIIVKSDYKMLQIPLDNIIYIEGQKDYVKICLDVEPFMVSTLLNLKMLEVSLPTNRFLRVHRSYIVNTDKIRLIERNHIVFGKIHIPISEGYKAAYTAYIHKHLVNFAED